MMPPRGRTKDSRQRVLQAAQDLVSTKGFQATTMADIAHASGVAVQTVYFQFRNRTGLLQALWERAVFGEERLPPPQQSWFVAAAAEPDLRKALNLIVGGGIGIAKRLAPLAATLEGLPSSPDLDEFRRRDLALRHSGLRQTAEMLAAKAQLARGVTLDEAADVMLVMLSPDAYRYLVVTRQWTEKRFRSWVVDALAATLFKR